MPRRHVPRRGDIVWLSLTPQAGHLQAGRRPALVLSPSTINPDQFGMEVAPACRFGRRVDQTSVQARAVQREIVVGIERAPVARWMIVNLDPIIAQHAPDVAAVAPSGVLEGTTVDELRAALTSLLGERRTKLLVDLGGLANVDSSGLSMIVAVMKLARRLGGDLRLCAPRPDIHSLLDTLGLLGQIGVYPGRQEALASWLPSPW